MGLFNRFRRSAPQQSAVAAEQYDLPTDKHQQIVNDLIDAGATTEEALHIVANTATRNWHAAAGNYTRGNLHEAELNATEGRLGGAR